jgi:hypothetical protein
MSTENLRLSPIFQKRLIKKCGHSRSEWSGVFEGPSASSLGSGHAKTPPARPPGVPALAFFISCLSLRFAPVGSQPTHSSSPWTVRWRAGVVFFVVQKFGSFPLSIFPGFSISSRGEDILSFSRMLE